MDLREKAIKGLTLCRYDPDPGMPDKFEVSCSICPYYDERSGCGWGEMLNDAVNLLKGGQTEEGEEGHG